MSEQKSDGAGGCWIALLVLPLLPVILLIPFLPLVPFYFLARLGRGWLIACIVLGVLIALGCTKAALEARGRGDTKRAKRLLVSIVYGVLLVVAVTAPIESPPGERIPVPEYTGQEVSDASIVISVQGVVLPCIRKRVEVTLRETAVLSERQVTVLATAILAPFLFQSGGVNAIDLKIWFPRQATLPFRKLCAHVVWAPQGEWFKACDVNPGDYKHHQTKILYLATSSD